MDDHTMRDCSMHSTRWTWQSLCRRLIPYSSCDVTFAECSLIANLHSRFFAHSICRHQYDGRSRLEVMKCKSQLPRYWRTRHDGRGVCAWEVAGCGRCHERYYTASPLSGHRWFCLSTAGGLASFLVVRRWRRAMGSTFANINFTAPANRSMTGIARQMKIRFLTILT